jgi:uncharacterized protein YkwD
MLTGLASACTAAKPPEAALTADEALVLRMINQERQGRELAPLELDPVLIKVAREHSQDMAERGYFGHLAPAPAPTTPLDRYAAAIGRKPREVVGENIGRSGEPVMAMIHESMMESPEHKANIVDVEYSRVGVGIYAMADGRVWVTEMFRGASPSDAPTSGG